MAPRTLFVIAAVLAAAFVDRTAGSCSGSYPSYSGSGGTGATVSASTPLAIPDGVIDEETFEYGPGPPVTAYPFVPTPFVIETIRVRVVVQHPKVSELTISIKHPDGTTVSLFNREGGDRPDLNSVTFDDTAAKGVNEWTEAGSPEFDLVHNYYTGTFKPESPLAVFVGKPAQGTWQVLFTDSRGVDTGNVKAVELLFTCAAPPLPPPPPPPIGGDPHFFGLDGSKFEFVGEQNSVFALISDPTMQLNALFVPGPGNRTFLGALCMRFCNDSVIISGPDHASINGKGLSIGGHYINDKLVVHRHHKHELEAVVIDRWAMTFRFNQHVDMSSLVADFAYDGKVHGVMGHTMARTPEQTRHCNEEVEGGCEVVGDWRDYIVHGDLCSTEWTHSQFDASACLP